MQYDIIIKKHRVPDVMRSNPVISIGLTVSWRIKFCPFTHLRLVLGSWLLWLPVLVLGFQLPLFFLPAVLSHLPLLGVGVGQDLGHMGFFSRTVILEAGVCNLIQL